MHFRGHNRNMLRIRDELLHNWDVGTLAAEQIQRSLAQYVRPEPLAAGGPESPQLAAGVDVGYTRDGLHSWAVAVVLDRRMRVVERCVVSGKPDRGYEPGLLAFREGRLTIEVLLSLETTPGVIFCDGHGVVHERGLGLASHVGVLLNMPTVGVPKTPFHAIDHDPGPHRGDFYVLTKEWGAQGAAIRLRDAARPVYVSPGHRCDLSSAIQLALTWSTGHHRVPEPLQAADTASKLARQGL
jgi:deoxyribonuclease V